MFGKPFLSLQNRESKLKERKHSAIISIICSLVEVSLFQWNPRYKLTPWSRVLLQKLIVSHLVKKFHTLYGT
jgi:hypothetical protein